jgi:hypothetical protein
MNVAGHGHDLNGVPICVFLVAFAEERSAARGSRSGCAIDPMIRSEPRDGWAGGLVWSFGRLGSLPDACSAGARGLCFVQSRRSQPVTTGRKRNGYWDGEVV